jgi:hypothetical protein
MFLVKVNVPCEGSVIIEDYEMLRAIWFEKCRNFSGCTVEVLDYKTKKKSKGGFQ